MSTFYYYRDYISKWFNTSPPPSHDYHGYSREQVKTASDEAWLKIYRVSNHQNCYFCGNTELTSWKNNVEEVDKTERFTLNICPSCGWWKMTNNDEYNYIPGYDSPEVFIEYRSHEYKYYALLETFDISDDNAPLDEVTNVLLSDWKYSKHISAQTAQDLVLNVFKNHMNCDVHYYDNAVYHPDGGIDFVLVQTDDSKLAFQVKRRQTDKNEGITKIREFIGAVAESPYKDGIYVTTALNYTSKALKEMSEVENNIRNKNMKISLVDGSRLRSLLELHKPTNKSMSVISEKGPETGWRNSILGDSHYSLDEVFMQTKQLNNS